jgi:CRP/FNR family cyclic AMP-dependent transcriptional regulator
MITTLDLLIGHPFLAGMPASWLDKLSYQAKRAVYHPGYRIFHEGRHAGRFWLIRDGSVALDIAVPGRGDVVIETIGPGTVLGWSWLMPPHRWHFGARAVEQTLAIEFNAEGVLRLCEDDPALGFELTRRFMNVLVDRLQHSRDRLLALQDGDLPAASAEA